MKFACIETAGSSWGTPSSSSSGRKPFSSAPRSTRRRKVCQPYSFRARKMRFKYFCFLHVPELVLGCIQAILHRNTYSAPFADSIFRYLQDLHPSAPLRTRILQVFAPLRELSLNFPKFAKFRLKALNPISRIDYFSSNISRNFAVIAWSPMYSPEGILLNLFYKKCLHKMFWTYKKVCKMNNLDQFG